MTFRSVYASIENGASRMGGKSLVVLSMSVIVSYRYGMDQGIPGTCSATVRIDPTFRYMA